MLLSSAGTAMVMKFKPVPDAPAPAPAAAPSVPAPKVSQQTLPAGYHDVRLRQYNIS